MNALEGEEVATVETTEAAQEAAVLSQEQENAPDPIETEARKQGWRPKDEWSGDPDNWKDAKTYVEHGEVKSRIAKIEKDYAERFARIEQANQKALDRQKKQFEAEIEVLKAQKREAVKAGDVDAVDRIDAEIDQRRTAGTEVEKPKTNEEVQSEWEAKNPWYDPVGNPELYDAAFAYSNRIAAGKPNMTLTENLEKVEAYMRQKFPAAFGGKKPAANGHAAVDGGGAFDSAFKTKGKGADDLPPEARTAGLRFVKQGLFKNLTEYAKDYFNEQ